MDLARGLDTLLLTAVVAALAPVLVALLPGPRIPQVVVLLAGGVLIGPEGLGWADRAEIDLLANVGLGFLFLLAGYELDLRLFRSVPFTAARALAFLSECAAKLGAVERAIAASRIREGEFDSQLDENTLTSEMGDEEATRLLRVYGDAFPQAYQEDYPADIAVADLLRLDALQRLDHRCRR
jgi:hypothetical protein